MDERKQSESDLVESGGIWVPPSARPRDAAEPAAPVEEPEAPAAEVDFQDKYLRALAELDNYRRRSQEQQRTAVQRANETFLAELLPVIDGLDRGLEAARGETSIDKLQAGLELVSRQLHSFLETHGVEPLECRVGDLFDPELHEAVMRGPATEEVPEGHILSVWERGVKLNGRVVRPARVGVATAPLDVQAD